MRQLQNDVVQPSVPDEDVQDCQSRCRDGENYDCGCTVSAVLFLVYSNMLIRLPISAYLKVAVVLRLTPDVVKTGTGNKANVDDTIRYYACQNHGLFGLCNGYSSEYTKPEKDNH